MLRTICSFRLVVLLIAAAAVFGCSEKGNSNITLPQEQIPSSTIGSSASGRMLWGMWEISLNPAKDTMTALPARKLQAHFNITDMLLPPECDDCLAIAVNSFDPVTRILDVDVTLRNPSPLNGYDVRGILYTNDYGHELRNADDWTDLWEVPGGTDINPFRAFAKDVENRVFESGAEHTENYLIYIPVPPNYWAITFAVDASWPGNCREPYSIEGFAQDGELYDEAGSSVNIQVDVLDWQDDVSEVMISVPLITGDDFNNFTPLSGTTWGLTLVNNLGAAAGEYEARLTVKSSNSGDLALYDFATITVDSTGTEFDPIDITPPWLNFSPREICVEGDFLYIIGSVNGLHIFDVSDPENPTWINKVDILGDKSKIDIDGDYVCVGTHWTTDPNPSLHIVDVSDPYNAYLAGSLDMSSGMDYAIQGGYVFVAGGSAGLMVVDIDPPASMSIVQTIDDLTAYNVELTDDYAYIRSPDETINIVDISDPLNAFTAGSLEVPSDSLDYIAVDYPYLGVITSFSDSPSNIYYIFKAFDISTPLEPMIIGGSGLLISAYGLHLYGNRAYVGHGYETDVFEIGAGVNHLYHFDLVAEVASIDVAGDYAFCITWESGLFVLDISGSESAQTVASVYTPCLSTELVIYDGYAYTGGWHVGVQIYDISPANLSHSISGIDERLADGVGVIGNYLFASPTRMKVYDITDVMSPAFVTEVIVYGDELFLTEEYAYLAGSSDGLCVIDINPIESAAVVKEIDLTSAIDGIEVVEGFAYLAACHNGLMIVDLEPIEDAHLYKTVDTPDRAEDIAVHNGYAFIAERAGSLEIFDIDPVEDTLLINTVPLSGDAHAIDISGDYAYIGTQWESRIDIVDISIPEAAFIEMSIELPVEYLPNSSPPRPEDIVVIDNYVFLLYDRLGIIIYQLWE